MSDTCTVTVPAPSYSLAFSQSTYYADFLGVDISCTLTSNGSPVSGETVTFTVQEPPMVTNVYTATTGSNGVANVHVTVYDNATVTATYESASATCTVEYDGF